MSRTIVLKGHVVGSNTIQVDEPLPAEPQDVQVILRIPDEDAGNPDRVAAFLRSLPPGSRSKEDIDQQIDEGRGSWDT